MSERLYVVAPDGEAHELGPAQTLTSAADPENEPVPWADSVDASWSFEMAREAAERVVAAFAVLTKRLKRSLRRCRNVFRYIGQPEQMVKYLRRQNKAIARSRRNTHYKRYKHGRTYRTR